VNVAATVKPYEWFEPWVPMWTQVGRFMHWEPKIEAMARNYVYHAFKLNSETDPFPEVCLFAFSSSLISNIDPIL